MLDFKREEPVLIADVAKRFNVSRRTVDNWIAKGLEAEKLGGLVFTTWEAISRFAVEIPSVAPAASQRRSRSAQKEIEAFLALK